MNISKRDQKLLLILASLAAFLALYLLVITPFNNKKETVQSEISQLNPQLTELRDYNANMAGYKTETDKIKTEVDSALSQYPNDVRSEDMIMYATELADKIGIDVQSISIEQPAAFAQFTVPDQSQQALQLLTSAAMKVQFTITCNLNYEQMKKLFDYVYKTSKQTSLESVTLSYNSETGNLLGTAAINKYFVVSSDYVYVPTRIPTVQTGIDDPFGTFATGQMNAADGAGNAGNNAQ